MTCKSGEELNAKGNCVKKCAAGTIRNPESGRCKTDHRIKAAKRKAAKSPKDVKVSKHTKSRSPVLHSALDQKARKLLKKPKAATAPKDVKVSKPTKSPVLHSVLDQKARKLLKEAEQVAKADVRMMKGLSDRILLQMQRIDKLEYRLRACNNKSEELISELKALKSQQRR